MAPQKLSASNTSVIDSVVPDRKLYSSDSLLIKNQTTDNLVFPKRFEEDYRVKYSSSEFDYSIIKPKESLWEKFKRRINKIVEAIFGNIDPSKTARYTEIIVWTLAILIIGFVLYLFIRFLLNKNGSIFFSKKNKKLSLQNQDLKENIHEINFSESIANCEKQEEYRSAIRYQFLLVLKKLADAKQIHWNPEKTNKDYIQELKNLNQKREFEELVYIFDYIWYGEFEIDKRAYDYFKQKFIHFNVKNSSDIEQVNFKQEPDNHE